MHSQNTHTEKSVLSHLLFLLLGPCLFLLILAPGRPETMTPEAHKVGAIAAWMAVWWLTDIIRWGNRPDSFCAVSIAGRHAR